MVSKSSIVHRNCEMGFCNVMETKSETPCYYKTHGRARITNIPEKANVDDNHDGHNTDVVVAVISQTLTNKLSIDFNYFLGAKYLLHSL